MGKCKNATKAGGGAQRDASPTLLSCGGGPEDTAQDLIEEASLQMGISSKAPFRFTLLKRFPSIHSLLLEGRQTCSTTPDNEMFYCVHIRVTLEEGGGNQPPPSHTWSGSLIADMLQEACPRDHITKAVILAPGEAILFFGGHLHREGLPIECKGHWIQLERSS